MNVPEQNPSPAKEAGPYGFVAGFCTIMGASMALRTSELIDRSMLDSRQTIGFCLATLAVTLASGLSWQEFHQIRDGKAE
jgi:hypothetical protein